MKKIVSLLSLSFTFLLADPAANVAGRALLRQMNLNINQLPTVAFDSSMKSVNINESRSATFNLTNNKVIIIKDKDITTQINGNTLTVTLNNNVELKKGQTLIKKIILVPYKTQEYGKSVILKVVFTNPEEAIKPVFSKINDVYFNENDNIKEVSFEVNESENNSSSIDINNLSVDNSNKNVINALLVDNKHLKLIRVSPEAGSATITINAINSHGLKNSISFNVTLAELNVAPVLALATKNVTIYSNSNWEKNISYTIYDYNGNFSNLNLVNNYGNVEVNETHSKLIENIIKTGDILWEGNITVSGNSVGNYCFNVNATNGVKESKTQQVCVNVLNKNFPPVLSLPFNSIEKLPQGKSVTKDVILDDENDGIKDLNVTLSLKIGSKVLDTNTSTSKELTVTDGNVKIDFDKTDKTITVTTLQDNENAVYTVTIQAEDKHGAKSALNTFTITTSSLKKDLIDSLIPVEIKDYTTSQCKPMYNYPDVNLSDKNNFKINYDPANDVIQLVKFDYNSTLNFDGVNLNYSKDAQMYGGTSEDGKNAVAIKFGIKEAGQFSDGRMMCVAFDENASNEVCWALATPEQKEKLDEYENTHCK